MGFKRTAHSTRVLVCLVFLAFLWGSSDAWGINGSGGIIIEKQTVPDGSSQSFEFSTSYGPNFSLTGGETNYSGPLSDGVYSVSEVNIPTDWDLVSATCDDGSDPSAISLSAGETVTCTFINEQRRGRLEVVKDLEPATDSGKFDLQIDGVTDPDGDDVGNGGSTGVESVSIGNHTVGEVAGTGTDLSDYDTQIECRDNNGAGAVVASANNAGPLSVPVNASDDIVCTITNSRKGIIIVEKLTDPDGSLQSFEFSRNWGGNFFLACHEGQVSTGMVPYDGYSVSEVNIPDGWDLVSATCDDGSDPSHIDLDPGEIVTCTFYNTLQQDLIINEIHADPDTINGDANGDGTVDTSQDEFVEIVNDSDNDVDISGWTLFDSIDIRHVFPAGTVVPARCAIVVFGGGTPTGPFGGAMVQTASTGSLLLNNSGDTVILFDGLSNQAMASYGSEGGDNQSLTRDPDITGSFVKHSVATGSGGVLFSPGAMIPGTLFSGCLSFLPGDITVHKFDDQNGNGVLDVGEPGLAGWTITLYAGFGCTASNELASGTTDAAGNVTFSNLIAGDYSIQETLQAGWQNTTSLCQAVTLAAGGFENVSFGNQEQPGTIIVEKQTEPDGAPGIFTFNGDAAGSIEDGGQIVVGNLSSGTYTAQETVPSGWELTSITCDDSNSGGDISTATATFQLEPGETVKCVFSNTLASIVIDPDLVTLLVGGAEVFSAGGGLPPYTWSLKQDQTAASLVSDVGGTAVYTAGSLRGTDVVQVTDSLGGTAHAIVKVLEPAGPIPQDGWALLYTDSDTTGYEAEKAFDGDPTTMWHTLWGKKETGHPHEVWIDLGDMYTINGFRYLPRQDGSENGWVGEYACYVSKSKPSSVADWGLAVAQDTFPADAVEKEVTFLPVVGRYWRFVAHTEVNGNPWTSAAEFSVLQTGEQPFLISPAFTKAEPGDMVVLGALGGMPPYVCALDRDESGCGIVENGDGTVDYTAGFLSGIDVLRMTDDVGKTAVATVIVDGPLVLKDDWELWYVDSEELVGSDGAAVNAIDGDPTTIWHTAWSESVDPSVPHEIWVDMGEAYMVSGLLHLPRQDGSDNGRVEQFAFYVAKDKPNAVADWGMPLVEGAFENNALEQEINFSPVEGRYWRFVALREVNDRRWTSVAELDIRHTGTLPFSIEPSEAHVATGESIHFSSRGGTPPFTCTLAQDNSGAWFTDNGNGTADYIAGSTVGTDVVQMIDGNGDTAEAIITVNKLTVPKSHWALLYVDSEERFGSDGAAVNAFDDNPDTIWHTAWSRSYVPDTPHEIWIDLGAVYTIAGFRYLPRQDGSDNGRIEGYSFYAAVDEPSVEAEWGTAVVQDIFSNDDTEKEVTFTPVAARYVRWVAETEVNDNPWTSAAEFDILLSSP